MEFKKPRGTTDWYGSNLNKLNEIKLKLQNLAINFGFQEIVTPTFENLNLFKKSIGEVTDIAQKELYIFQDKKERWMALRPEGTSSVVRAYVEEKLFANKNNASKFFYILNLFRYERPQNGRLREFHQFGVEYLNVTNHLYDIECILLGNKIIEFFGLQKNVQLKINYLGNFVQRQEWMNKLKNYFDQYKDQLSDDSKNRLSTNPLRILDDKIDSKKDFVINAPKLNKFLNENDKKIFEDILNGLSTNNINYVIDHNLVRGLDYYTGIVFEFVYINSNSKIESTIIGGGRYSDLIKQTGGPNEIGLGFAMGLERLLIALEDINYNFQTNKTPEIVIGASSYESSLAALHYMNILRDNNIFVVMDFGNYKKDKNVKYAIKNKANYFIFIEDKDICNPKLNVENMINHNKELLTIDELLTRINK